MSAVQDFERAFAEYVGARYAIALCNGTATLHTALVALGVEGPSDSNGDYYEGDRVAVPPLTMSATTIAVLHAGATPVFVDVDPDTWLMDYRPHEGQCRASVPVSLYGLVTGFVGPAVVDAAQTLQEHMGAGFTSYSFQASKILALGEGGMLVTNDETLAIRARSFSSLGYPMQADKPGIDKRALKDPAYARHHSLGWNYRMAEAVAALGINPDDCSQRPSGQWDERKQERQRCAALYRDAVAGCSWIRPQQVPRSGTHDYWAYPVALESADLWHPFADAVERHGGTRPFAAWRLTYQEPAFRHLAEDGTCPVAEDLQPRIVAGQTNCQASATRNAAAWAAAIKELNG